MDIRPGITAAGFRTAVRDYTANTVIEEMAANSYDADAKTLLVLLSTSNNTLYVVDDGNGFNEDALHSIAILGEGTKTNSQYSLSNRHYLGSYGYGLKSTLNIANKVEVNSFGEDGEFRIVVDWSRLEEALKSNFEGFPVTRAKTKRTQSAGTIIRLALRAPSSQSDLDAYLEALSNLPSDGGKFKCYVGLTSDLGFGIESLHTKLAILRKVADDLVKRKRLRQAKSEELSDIADCQKQIIQDKEDENVSATIYFAGLDGDKVRHLKPGLRGIYVRIHGRLLKQSFTAREYTYNISKWVKFESALRVEISIDWLRDQITLSREGIRFSNPKLQEQFKSTLTRLVGSFIQPQLKQLENKKGRLLDKNLKQRLELAQRRVSAAKDTVVLRGSSGFGFRPETDAELALLVGQREVMNRIDKNLKLIDYNDQAPFDSMFYDSARREFLRVEFEPNLMEFLQHKEKESVEMIVTWSLGKWRTGAKKKGRNGAFELVSDRDTEKGQYKLLEFASQTSKKPRKHYRVIVLEEILKK